MGGDARWRRRLHTAASGTLWGTVACKQQSRCLHGQLAILLSGKQLAFMCLQCGAASLGLSVVNTFQYAAAVQTWAQCTHSAEAPALSQLSAYTLHCAVVHRLPLLLLPSCCCSLWCSWGQGGRLVTTLMLRGTWWWLTHSRCGSCCTADKASGWY